MKTNDGKQKNNGHGDSVPKKKNGTHILSSHAGKPLPVTRQDLEGKHVEEKKEQEKKLLRPRFLRRGSLALPLLVYPDV